MKIKVSIILFIFGISGISSIMKTSASTLSMQQFDKSTMIKKKLANAQKSISNEDYIAAQNTLNSLLKLEPNNGKAKELLDECESGIKKQKQRVHQAYLDACKAGTISAFQNFISKYPNSEYVSSAKSRIEDYSLWQKAKEQNTITAYNYYLSQSSILAYKNDAEDAITTIQSEIEWNNCKTSNDEDKINSFIKNNPSSKYVNQAKYRLNILKGERYYASKNYNQAYTYLNEADNFQTLIGAPATHLKMMNETIEYESIMSCSDVSKVKSYLNALSTSSPFYVPTSNKIALLLGSALSMYSSEYSMNEALVYAKDDNTRAAVKRYISKAKADKAFYERQRKKNAHKRWWSKNFKVGIDADFGTNINGDSGADMFYSTGLLLRFGNVDNVFSLVTGLKYRWFRVMPEYDGYYDNGNIEWQYFAGGLNVPLNFRFNVGKIANNSSIYLGLGTEYGFKLFPAKGMDGIVNNNYFSIYPQFGVMWPHFELSCYWKTYTVSPFDKYASSNFNEYKCNSLLGMQMSVYF